MQKHINMKLPRFRAIESESKNGDCGKTIPKKQTPRHPMDRQIISVGRIQVEIQSTVRRAIQHFVSTQINTAFFLILPPKS